MKKRTVVIIACAIFSVGLVAGVMAAGAIEDITAQLRPDFTIEIDGEVKEFKNVNGEVVYPILYEGTTYLPVRAIGEIMGKTVFWYEDEKRVELKETTVTDADVIIPGGDSTPAPVRTPDVTLPVEPTPEVRPFASEDNFIGKDKAQELALAKAGLTASEVIFEKTELDEDDGIWHYEVEFRKDLKEYNADIKADDGSILKWEVDLDD